MDELHDTSEDFHDGPPELQSPNFWAMTSHTFGCAMSVRILFRVSQWSCEASRKLSGSGRVGSDVVSGQRWHISVFGLWNPILEMHAVVLDVESLHCALPRTPPIHQSRLRPAPTIVDIHGEEAWFAKLSCCRCSGFKHGLRHRS